MAGRRPVRFSDHGEFARLVSDAKDLEIDSYVIIPEAMDVVRGWWADRKNLPSHVGFPGFGRSLVVSEPEGAQDGVSISKYAWEVKGPSCGFEVAAEVGHRIGDIAHVIGRTGVSGVAMGNADKATLVVVSHSLMIPGELDDYMPEIVARTNEQLGRDRIPIQLPLDHKLDQPV